MNTQRQWKSAYRRLVQTAYFTCVITALLVLVGCGDGSTVEPGQPGLTCQGGGVLSDTGGTNGFGRVHVTDAVFAAAAPIDIAFVPGNEQAFVVATQGGSLYYFNNGCTPVNVTELAGRLPIGSSSGEQGLLNIEFHPDFAASPYLFAYHTSIANTVNSISRLTVSFDTDGELVLTDIVRIIDFRKADAATASNHNGGGLVFAPDGTLLASVGDGGANATTAQDNGRLLGKVIRILPSLTTGVGGYSNPSGNMFASGNAQCSNVTFSATPCPEILAKGLRNPFRMSIDAGIVYLGDVGSTYEEINSFSYNKNSLNFGWPTHDGPAGMSALPGYRNPIIAYRRNVEAAAFRAEDPVAENTGLASIIVGDVYHGTRYDGTLDNSLLFGDFYDGYNRYVGVAAGPGGDGVITDNDGVPGAHLLHENAVSSVVRGPDGFIYLTTLFGEAAVYRLVRP